MNLPQPGSQIKWAKIQLDSVPAMEFGHKLLQNTKEGMSLMIMRPFTIEFHCCPVTKNTTSIDTLLISKRQDLEVTTKQRVKPKTATKTTYQFPQIHSPNEAIPAAATQNSFTFPWVMHKKG